MSQTIEKTAADLAPFEIREVMLDNSTIRFREPLVLTPEWLPDDPNDPDENEYLTVKVPELNISAVGSDIEELVDCVQSCINFGWRHYVQPDDSQLNYQIREIKRNYLAIAEEVFDG